MRVNLLQEEELKYSINWLNIIFIFSIFLFISFLGIRYYLSSLTVNNLKIELESIETELNLLIPHQEKYREVQKDLDQLKTLPIIEAEEYLWGDVIREMGYIIPEKMMLTSLEIIDKEIALVGIAADAREVTQFIYNLNHSPYFTEVDLSKISKQKEINFQIEAIIRGGD